jgi:hypothetical protein
MTDYVMVGACRFDPDSRQRRDRAAMRTLGHLPAWVLSSATLAHEPALCEGAELVDLAPRLEGERLAISQRGPLIL